MVQDYHLTLVPRMLAQRRPDLAIAHFSHTPWAPPDYFALLPDDVAREVLEGILGADHAGFHAERWASAFLDCCEAVLGAEVDRAARTVRHAGHTTTVGVHPLGVDAAQLRARAAADDVQAHIAALSEVAGGRKLIVRIDRTELSKNIVRGLAAYRELLITWPQWRGKVTHLAFAYPSRHDLPEYREYTASVQRMAREIVDEFGTEDWDPLVLQVNDDYPRSLAAYRLADVLLVNPVRDGMNLVAKEGPLLSDRGCAVVLSREAGAAAELAEGALLVNPYDVSATAQALHEALSMNSAERNRRAALLAQASAACPPQQWLASQLSALGAAAGQGPQPAQPAGRLTSFGPSTTRSACAASAVTSSEALQTATPARPSARAARTASKAGRSPRSSPANRTAAGSRSAISAVSAVPLLMPGGRSSMTSRPGLAVQPGVGGELRHRAGQRAPARPAGRRSGGRAPRARGPCPRPGCPRGHRPRRARRAAGHGPRRPAGGGGGEVSWPPSQRSKP